MSFKICRTCSHHYLGTETSCPQCSLHQAPRSLHQAPRKKGIGLAILLGLSTVACNGKEGDTASDTAADTAEDPVPEPTASDLYGVPEGDASEEVWTEE